MTIVVPRLVTREREGVDVRGARTGVMRAVLKVDKRVGYVVTRACGMGFGSAIVEVEVWKGRDEMEPNMLDALSGARGRNRCW